LPKVKCDLAEIATKREEWGKWPFCRQHDNMFHIHVVRKQLFKLSKLNQNQNLFTKFGVDLLHEFDSNQLS
jgi:hypothetical protein